MKIDYARPVCNTLSLSMLPCIHTLYCVHVPDALKYIIAHLVDQVNANLHVRSLCVALFSHVLFHSVARFLSSTTFTKCKLFLIHSLTPYFSWKATRFVSIDLQPKNFYSVCPFPSIPTTTMWKLREKNLTVAAKLGRWINILMCFLCMCARAIVCG